MSRFFVLHILISVTMLLIPFAAGAQEEEEPEFFICESINDSIDLRSNFYDVYDSLSMFFPSSDVYETWDNDNLHYPKIDFSKKEDTTLVVLCDHQTSFFVMPRKGRINSDYGYRRRRFHYGIDIDLEIGDSVLSAFDGMVRVSRYHKGYGNVVVIRHFNGLETTYGHLSVARVMENQIVKAGEMIGYGGNTGRSTGPHLHFETRYLGTPFNPRKIIDFEKNSLLSDTLLVSKYLFQHKGTTSRTTTTSGASQTTSRSGATYHTVKSGDTLSHLAVKYHTTVKTICALNGISAKSILRLGQKIRVK